MLAAVEFNDLAMASAALEWIRMFSFAATPERSNSCISVLVELKCPSVAFLGSPLNLADALPNNKEQWL
jgi:hypothetical protein